MNAPSTCFDCGVANLTRVKTTYEAETQDGNKVSVPDVIVLRCESCGAELLPPESLRRVTATIAAETDQLPRKQLYRFLEQFDLTQADAAEAVGLGAKTINRWLRGTQTVSRSMGYYLRALMEFPEVFDWVRRRAWRAPQTHSVGSRSAEPNAELTFHRFPALQKRQPSSTAVRCNAAAGLLFVSIDAK
jgi:transcriptional regulator with XRE-family HTH domain